MDIRSIHEELLNFLLDLKKNNKDLTFSLRKTNYGGKLDKGYWFDGDDDFLAVSFWKGWFAEKNIPELSFVIDKNHGCLFEINVPGQNNKIKFFNEHKNNFGLKMKFDIGLFTKHIDYDPLNFKSALRNFIDGDLEIINKKAQLHFRKEDSTRQLQRIGKVQFNKDLKRVQRYQKKRSEIEKIFSHKKKGNGNNYLEYIKVENHKGIKDVELDLRDSTSKWTFITGENGSGKTNLLSAIGIVLSNQKCSDIKDHFEAKVEISGVKGSLKERNDTVLKSTHALARIGNNLIENDQFLVNGLAMYGPFRLESTSNRTTDTNHNLRLGKRKALDALIKPSYKLLSIEKQFNIWANGNVNEVKLFQERKFYIANILCQSIPNLSRVIFKGDDGAKKNLFIFNHGENEVGITYNQLSSGNKSMINMIGDILIRLYHEQPKISDVSDLYGIVLIDEIDLHLHPIGQRDLVKNLANVFPRVQFIVTTHSPIPLLGAPNGSVFCKTQFQVGEGVVLTRLRKLENEIETLLPNTILTSDIFDFNLFEDMSDKKFDELKLEDEYDKIDDIKERFSELEKYSDKDFPANLFKDKN